MDDNVTEITVIDVVKSICSQHFINKVKILVDYFLISLIRKHSINYRY